jgi:hypothetical protein
MCMLMMMSAADGSNSSGNQPGGQSKVARQASSEPETGDEMERAGNHTLHIGFNHRQVISTVQYNTRSSDKLLFSPPKLLGSAVLLHRDIYVHCYCLRCFRYAFRKRWILQGYNA